MVGIIVGVICLTPGQYGAPISFPFASLAWYLPVHCLEPLTRYTQKPGPIHPQSDIFCSLLLQPQVSQPSVYGAEARR